MLLYYITDRKQFARNARSQRVRLLEKIAEAARYGVDFIQLREKDLSARELELLAREAVQVVRENSAPSGREGTTSAAQMWGTPERQDSHPSAQNQGARVGHPAEEIQHPHFGEKCAGMGHPENLGHQRTRLLINSRIDIALACGADGVHLTSTDIPAGDARAVWSELAFSVPCSPFRVAEWLIAVSCHTPAEVRMAEAQGADFAVFAPVFEKSTFPQRSGVGLDALRDACTGAVAAKNVEGVAAGRMPVLALGGITLENARACIEGGAAGIAAIRLFQENDIRLVVERLREYGNSPG